MLARLSQLSVGLLYLATSATIIDLAPDTASLLGDLRAPHRWLDRVGTDAAASQFAGALLWVVALWLGLGLLTSCLSALPGTTGRCCAAVARRTTPVAVRRLVAASTGASLLFSPLTALAEPAGAAHLPVSAAGHRGTAVTPAWPVAQQARPSAPADPPPTATPQTPRTPAPPADRVLVKPGDSLWTIAADRLGPGATDAQIAVEWPYWYWANRAAIGQDPGLIRAGSTLAEPAPAPGDQR